MLARSLVPRKNIEGVFPLPSRNAGVLLRRTTLFCDSATREHVFEVRCCARHVLAVVQLLCYVLSGERAKWSVLLWPCWANKTSKSGSAISKCQPSPPLMARGSICRRQMNLRATRVGCPHGKCCVGMSCPWTLFRQARAEAAD